MRNLLYVILFIVTIFIISCYGGASSSGPKMVRLARIVVDSAQLENYKILLKEGIEASIKSEPGVLTLYAVFEKDRPAHVTILEIYADSTAYESHIKTPHFLKYKNETLSMVKELELIESDPLIPGLKIK